MMATMPLPLAAPPAVVVDAFRGEIEVIAHDAHEVLVVVKETARARSPERLARARQEVSLEITDDGGYVELYVDGPFRDRDRRRRGSGGRRR